MLRILVYLFLLINLCFGYTYSSSEEDGIHQAFEELDQVIKQHNDEVLKKYKSEIEPLIKQIDEQTQIKKRLLTEIRNLEKERLKDSYNHQFLMEQEKKLLGIESDVGGAIK